MTSSDESLTYKMNLLFPTRSKFLKIDTQAHNHRQSLQAHGLTNTYLEAIKFVLEGVNANEGVNAMQLTR